MVDSLATRHLLQALLLLGLMGFGLGGDASKDAATDTDAKWMDPLKQYGYTASHLRNKVEHGEFTTFELGSPNYKILNPEDEPEYITADQPHYQQMLRRLTSAQSGTETIDVDTASRSEIHRGNPEQKSTPVPIRFKEPPRQIPVRIKEPPRQIPVRIKEPPRQIPIRIQEAARQIPVRIQEPPRQIPVRIKEPPRQIPVRITEPPRQIPVRIQETAYRPQLRLGPSHWENLNRKRSSWVGRQKRKDAMEPDASDQISMLLDFKVYPGARPFQRSVANLN